MLVDEKGKRGRSFSYQCDDDVVGILSPSSGENACRGGGTVSRYNSSSSLVHLNSCGRGVDKQTSGVEGDDKVDVKDPIYVCIFVYYSQIMSFSIFVKMCHFF